MALITHLDEAHHDTPDTATVKVPATLTDEQRRRVADALESAQSESARRNYAGQLLCSPSPVETTQERRGNFENIRPIRQPLHNLPAVPE